MEASGEITRAEFERVDPRVGTGTAVEECPAALRPAYKLWIDFGPNIGVRKLSAQMGTQSPRVECKSCRVARNTELVGRQRSSPT